MAYEKEVQDFTATGTDLPESKLSTGFVAGERPPANWFNSLFSRMAQAIKELQTKSAEKEYVEEQLKNVTIELDTQLSTTSENAVQNKVITTELNKKSEVYTFTGGILTEGWVEDTQNWEDGTVITQYYYDMPVIGLLETDKPHITPVYRGYKVFDEPIQEAWNKIDRAVAGTNNLRVYAFSEIPTTEITIQIEVVR